MDKKITSIKERVLLIAKEKGISYENFCEGIGMTYGSFKGDQKKSSLNSDAIGRILSNYPDIDLHWLLTGDENMTSAAQQPLFSYGRRNAIPLLSVDALADFQKNIVSEEEVELASYSLPVFDEIGVEFLIKVTSASMAPLYSSGDLIGCKTLGDLSFIQWGKTYLVQTKQGYLINRLFPNPGDKNGIICRSENSDKFPPFNIQLDAILSASLILGTIRID